MGIRREDFKDTLVNGIKIAVGDGTSGYVIEVAEPVSDFAAALNADDRNMGVGCKDKQVETAADDNPALGGASLNNGWFRAFK